MDSARPKNSRAKGIYPMSFSDLVNHATDKERFHTIKHYIDFCARYLEYVDTKLQARIVSQNESHYQFFQYRKEGSFNITRPLNSRLMYDAEGFAQAAQQSVSYTHLRAHETDSYLVCRL